MKSDEIVLTKVGEIRGELRAIEFEVLLLKRLHFLRKYNPAQPRVAAAIRTEASGQVHRTPLGPGGARV